MITSFIRFAFICFLFSSAAVFSADNVTNSTEQAAPQNTSNTQLPEWFYRELTSIRKDVSVLDATGASKEQIQELKERIGKVEVRLEEAQLRTEGKLSQQNERIGDIADSNSFSVSLFSIIAGILGLLIAGLSWFFSWSAKREAVASAKEEVQTKLTAWMKDKDDHYEKALQIIRDDAKLLLHQIEINKGILLANVGKVDEALKIIDSVINEFSSSKNIAYQKLISDSLYAKYLILNNNKNFKEVVKVCDKLINMFENSDVLYIEAQVARALYNKGTAFYHLEKQSNAIAVHEDLVNRFKSRKEKDLKEVVIYALSAKILKKYSLDPKKSKESFNEEISFTKNGYDEYCLLIKFLRFFVEEISSDEFFEEVDILIENNNLINLEPIHFYIENPQSTTQKQAGAFVRFFEEHQDKARLKEELDQISKL